ncbi:hypothetical protein [Limnoglobus roseus]|uniref:Uncharacterized protein n=1 Tax=Limnoglobus roseus TaxID=2598579 RepID=A0A5C1A854_9BACT|nr:hypothetical protein [Limnoglobus roseus]QEL15509.1 hypothetical protein PX52LOC_02433 [Limnoglobus roseus]
MKRLRWPLLIVAICSPLALIVYGVRIPGLAPTEYASPRSVPEGDQEVAWFNTTTSGSSWERFIAGIRRTAGAVPGLTVDDSAAFLDQTATVPEVVLRLADRPHALRIRWYKLSGEHSPAYWCRLLAQRSPAPLAIFGGGSSDRARDMALALAHQLDWLGQRPLFFITNASAEKVHTGVEESDNPDEAGGQTTDLLRIYEGRTYRFCFNNKQMAEAMLDFLWQSPNLRPRLLAEDALLAAGSGLLAATQAPIKPTVFYVDWDDDPYSADLISQFREILYSPTGPKPTPTLSGWQVPFSVGGYYNPNRREEEVADAMLKELHKLPPQRSLLVMPTVAAPARRMLRTLCGASPGLGRKIVAINGDGMGVNTILRDGEFAWPVRSLPVPMILFSHSNPIGWDDGPTVEGGFRLDPPNSTEDVLHASEMVRTLIRAAFGEAATEPIVASGDELAARLRKLQPAVFDDTGNRFGGRGEYVCLVRPKFEDEDEAGLPEAAFEVWRRSQRRGWQLVGTRPLNRTSRVETGSGTP